MINIELAKSKELIYSFPIDAPFKIIHIDIYQVGTDQDFNGERSFMNILDGMTSFAISEPVNSDQLNSTGFAEIFIKVVLVHGICHTIVIDKDSKFRGTFEKLAIMLQINTHVASGGNHDTILTERFHVFLNKTLSLYTTERDSIRCTASGVFLSTYA